MFLTRLIVQPEPVTETATLLACSRLHGCMTGISLWMDTKLTKRRHCTPGVLPQDGDAILQGAAYSAAISYYGISHLEIATSLRSSQ